MIDPTIITIALSALAGGGIGAGLMTYRQAVNIKRIRSASRAERKRLDEIFADQWNDLSNADAARWDAEMKLVAIKAQKTRGPDGRFTSKTRAKSIAMAEEMGRADLVKRLEGLAK